MNTELDRIKSTITISLGTKNRLRKIKGSHSYEEFINHLIRLRNQTEPANKNLIEIQKFKRKKGIYSFDNHSVLFSYNKYNNSRNFFFDIKIEAIRDHGKKISFKEYIGKNNLKEEYTLYFKLLETAIQDDIEPLFRHNGRIEDYFSWKEEFKMLNLFEKSFEEDVMEKLNSYRHGVKLHD